MVLADSPLTCIHCASAALDLSSAFGRPIFCPRARRASRAAADWQANGQNESWLLRGDRLTKAEALAEKPRFRERVDPTREFLHASRQVEYDRIADIAAYLDKRGTLAMFLLANAKVKISLTADQVDVFLQQQSQ
jgi:hypothetical protein